MDLSELYRDIVETLAARVRMLSLAEGRGRIFNDLRAKLFADPAALQREYASSPAWLKILMDACADGLNFYIYKHPNAKPRVLARPWRPGR